MPSSGDKMERKGRSSVVSKEKKDVLVENSFESSVT